MFPHSGKPTGIVITRDVPNIRFVFASVPNSGPNNVFIFGRIVSSERIRIVVSTCIVQLMTSMADFTQSVPASLAHRVMARQHVGSRHGRN